MVYCFMLRVTNDTGTQFSGTLFRPIKIFFFCFSAFRCFSLNSHKKFTSHCSLSFSFSFFGLLLSFRMHKFLFSFTCEHRLCLEETKRVHHVSRIKFQICTVVHQGECTICKRMQIFRGIETKILFTFLWFHLNT